MGVITDEAAAAGAVGTNILSGHELETTPYPRLITAAAYVGGDAVGTGKIDIFVGTVRVAQNLEVTTAAQAVDMTKDVIPLGRIPVPPNAKISAVISEVTATNPTIVKIFTAP